jgi:uncharacterized RmlC-like cupin family protein
MGILVATVDRSTQAEAQGFSRFHIFNSTVTGCDAISLEYVRLAKGSESSPHAHVSSHTVVFTLTGRVSVYFGQQLEQGVTVGPFDCVYIPPGVIHYVVNEGDEVMTAVVARTPDRNVVEEFPDILTGTAFHLHTQAPGSSDQ